MYHAQFIETEGERIKGLESCYQSYSSRQALGTHHSCLHELLQEIKEFDCARLFYYEIDRAFYSSIEKNPQDAKEILRSYQNLMSLFMAIKAQTRAIEVQCEISRELSLIE